MGRKNTTGLDYREKGYQSAWDRLNPEKRKEYYDRYKPKSQRKYQRRRHWLDKYMMAKGCSNCGYNKSGPALDWDHVEPSKKKFAIGTRVPGASLKTLFAEIRKCIILCANCHRIKTYEERL